MSILWYVFQTPPYPGVITMGNKVANETEYKAVIDLALVALRSAILINGGAAIAILAFWGERAGGGTSLC